MIRILKRLGRVVLAGMIAGGLNALIPELQNINIVIAEIAIPLSVIIPAAVINAIGKWLRIKFGLSNVPV